MTKEKLKRHPEVAVTSDDPTQDHSPKASPLYFTPLDTPWDIALSTVFPEEEFSNTKAASTDEYEEGFDTPLSEDDLQGETKYGYEFPDFPAANPLETETYEDDSDDSAMPFSEDNLCGDTRYTKKFPNTLARDEKTSVGEDFEKAALSPKYSEEFSSIFIGSAPGSAPASVTPSPSKESINGKNFNSFWRATSPSTPRNVNVKENNAEEATIPALTTLEIAP